MFIFVIYAKQSEAAWFIIIIILYKDRYIQEQGIRNKII